MFEVIFKIPIFKITKNRLKVIVPLSVCAIIFLSSYVGRGNESKFNMKIDSNSKEIVLEKISDSKIYVATGLKIGDD